MKDPIQIIRLEDPETGEGFWCSRYIDADGNKGSYKIDNHSQFSEICERHDDFTKFPTLERDCALNSQISNSESKNYHFAFNTLEQLKEGLTMEEIKEFINIFGYKVLMLTVVDYFSSKFQTVFKKESIVKSEDISFMFL